MRHPFEIPRCKGAGTGHMGIVYMEKAKMLAQRIKTLQLRMRLHRITLKHIHGIFEHPWVAIGTARNEYATCRSRRQHANGILSRKDVARTDNGNIDARRHIVDNRPVGDAGIQLRRKPTMNGNTGNSSLLQACREIGSNTLAGGIPDTHLASHGNMRLAYSGSRNLGRKLRISHKRRALALGNDLSSRTRHIDIDGGEFLPHPFLNSLDGR